MKIEFTLKPDGSEVDFLTKMIDAETPDFKGVYPFAFFIRDDLNAIIAGCNGFMLVGSVYIDQLWGSSRVS